MIRQLKMRLFVNLTLRDNDKGNTRNAERKRKNVAAVSAVRLI